MALVSFKRISPFTTEQIREAQAYADAHMLPELMKIDPAEWDEYLEPEEPLDDAPPPSPPRSTGPPRESLLFVRSDDDMKYEFGTDHICPECFGVQAFGVTAPEREKACRLRALFSPATHSGHLGSCSRWKRWWPERPRVRESEWMDNRVCPECHGYDPRMTEAEENEFLFHWDFPRYGRAHAGHWARCTRWKKVWKS